jgi:TonB-linked SusC/RagA family outer membrane protein
LSATQQARADFILDSISKINTDWKDQFFQQGSVSNHQISLSGGTGKTRIYSSAELYNETGITTRTSMQRASIRNNMDYADDKFTFSVSSSLGYTKRSFQQSTVTNDLTNPFLLVNIQVPYALVYKPDGSYSTGLPALNNAANLLDITFYDKNYNDQLKAIVGITTSYKLTNDITAGITAGFDFRESQNTTYGSRLAFLRSPVATSSLTALAGSQNESLERTVTSNVRPSLSYKKLFGSRHDIEVNAIGEYIQENYKSFRVTGFGIDPRTPNTIAAVQPGNAANQLFITTGGLTGNNAKQASTLASGLGIFRYTYNSKYTLSGSFRMDGSSKLPPDTRWQSFYSAGFSWEASAEEFINRIKAINTLRLRLSYGGAGNADNFPSNYLYQATYASGSYSGLTTQVASYPGNPAAQWEKTWTSNIGIDFEILNRRIYGDLNWYDKRTKNLFVNRRLPAEAGTFSININAGELQNTGYEWNINADVIRNSKFTWTIFTQGAYNKNKLLSLGGEQPYQSGTSYLKIGLPLGSHYTVKWAGVDAATGQPLYYDLAGHVTTTYNASNSVSDFGTWEAPWKGGFGTNLRYKGLDFSLFFSWQQGAVKSDNLEYFVENPVGFLASGYNQSADLDFWRQPGDIASTPSPLYGTNFASKLLHDASFIRLRDLTIGYTFPKSITDRLKFVSNIKMFVQGSNLFIWTKWRGMDAEAGSVNINLSEFPNPRAFTGGINVTF